MKDVSGERSPLVLTIPAGLADSCTVDEKQRAKTGKHNVASDFSSLQSLKAAAVYRYCLECVTFI